MPQQWNDTIHTQEQWIQHKGELNAEYLHNGMEVPVSPHAANFSALFDVVETIRLTSE